MMSQPGPATLDLLISHAATATSIVALNASIRTNLAKDVRDGILAGPMASGQDPLLILDPKASTLLVLYILYVFRSISPCFVARLLCGFCFC
jgi:COP9 signalosome complex subunit 3